MVKLSDNTSKVILIFRYFVAIVLFLRLFSYLRVCKSALLTHSTTYAVVHYLNVLQPDFIIDILCMGRLLLPDHNKGPCFACITISILK